MSRGGSYNLWTPESKKQPSYPPPAYNVTGAGVADSAVDDGQMKPVYNQEEEEETDRGVWGHKAEFILSCVGLSVGLGNVWRFPYLAYQNGGAAFLIAYFVLQLLIGKPMYFMELVMGQFSGKGPTRVWDMVPAARGIGVSMCIISLVVAIYYNIIMAYTLYFFFSSMQETLPWTECTQEWKDVYLCVDDRRDLPPTCTTNNTYNLLIGNCTCAKDTKINLALPYQCFNGKTPSELFFEKEVIQKSIGVEPENIGKPLWKLALCLLLSWVIVIICLIKGIKSSGKVVYFTATFPYLILLVLLVRGATLEGAIDGVEFFIIPKWEKLRDIQVWVAAAGQMFFSLSVSFGGIIMFGSYNKFRNGVYYDALFISMMDIVTSVIAGFVVFTTFGGMAHTVGKNVEDVAKGGYGLAFVAYPEALSNLPPTQLWSVLFFFMLFTLGLDSEFALMETILTCLQDEIPKLRKHKSKLAVIFGIACYFMALPCTCPGGDYVVTIMDHYGADFSVLFLSCIEVIAVMWIYGAMRFLKDIEYMLGSKPTGWPYWIFCWAISAPILIAVLIVYRMINYSSPQYDNKEDYPEFAQTIGWVLLGVVLVPVPLIFLHRLFKGLCHTELENLSQVIKYMFGPTRDWLPNNKHERYQLPDGTPHGDGYPMGQKMGYANPAADITE